MVGTYLKDVTDTKLLINDDLSVAETPVARALRKYQSMVTGKTTDA